MFQISVNGSGVAGATGGLIEYAYGDRPPRLFASVEDATAWWHENAPTLPILGEGGVAAVAVTPPEALLAGWPTAVQDCAGRRWTDDRHAPAPPDAAPLTPERVVQAILDDDPAVQPALVAATGADVPAGCPAWMAQYVGLPDEPAFDLSVAIAGSTLWSLMRDDDSGELLLMSMSMSVLLDAIDPPDVERERRAAERSQRAQRAAERDRIREIKDRKPEPPPAGSSFD